MSATRTPSTYGEAVRNFDHAHGRLPAFPV
jgi:hypothetical protein